MLASRFQGPATVYGGPLAWITGTLNGTESSLMSLFTPVLSLLRGVKVIKAIGLSYIAEVVLSKSIILVYDKRSQ